MQTIFFFLTFNLIDVFAQFLFREVYRFRPLVVSGSFDLVLSKPISPLFRSLMGGADILDLITIPPLIYGIIYIGLALSPTLLHTAFYLLLIINGFLIATAFHIAVLSLGIITLEIDHTIMIFRDLTSLGRFPVDIYKEPLRGVITYLIPVGIMVTLPAKALMGLVSPAGVLGSLILGFFSVIIALKFWNFALTKYSSASS
jgi:ABC-2 type transport system permease protein